MPLLIPSSTRGMVLAHAYRVAGAVLVLLALANPEGTAAQPLPSGTPSFRASLATVDSLRNRGAFRPALDTLKALRDTHPTDTHVLLRLGVVWADLGTTAPSDTQRRRRLRRAVASAREALAADSTNAWAHLVVALTTGRLSEFGGTRTRVERSRAVKAHADRALALDSTLAGAYHVRGLWHRAVADLGFLQRAAVKIIYGGLPSASLEQSAWNFRRALALEERVYHHLELGRTYRAMDRPKAARQQFRRALAAPLIGPYATEQQEEARRLLRSLP